MGYKEEVMQLHAKKQWTARDNQKGVWRDMEMSFDDMEWEVHLQSISNACF